MFQSVDIGSASLPERPPTPSEANQLRFASFFAGIGGFDLGFQRAGMTPVFHCEIDPHCQLVLRRHWPEVPLHGDITTLQAEDIPQAEVWAGGWPCQDLSHANTDRKGLKGKRSGLFHDFVELASEARPRWLVLENVVGLLSAEGGEALEAVTDELEEVGYLGGWFACNTLDAGLPHHRERVFIVASYRSESAYKFLSNCRERYRDSPPGGAKREKSGSDLRGGTAEHDPLLVQRRGGFGYTKARDFSPTIRAQTGGHQGGHSDRPILCRQELDVGRVRTTDGLPRRMDGRRGRLIGNAVAPPIAEWIARGIIAVEEGHEEQVKGQQVKTG
ncbi:DNA cytosine methyltransferase [Luteimonas sp. Sa2BVA3]|uniref:DNA (cytosine-5-)-methyltransferase n=1 Tax=Luteimonas colneyensis TaxID=2762230 RepID=A0ABR8UG69_9GAMM|nr:DNA cytosine methyltransferase [Luteimonas colneyensis]MBD7987012.1 DNA cytosine methyltransferase [Luteimonas colneyensis]